jgi:hypothetical protein
MDLGKVLVSMLIFLFSVLFFPTLYYAAESYTGELAPLVHVFPVLFIVLVAVFPVFLLLMEEK